MPGPFLWLNHIPLLDSPHFVYPSIDGSMDPWVCLALAVVNSPRTHFLRGANPAVVFRDTGQTDPLQYSAYGPQTGLGFFQLNLKEKERPSRVEENVFIWPGLHLSVSQRSHKL